MELQSDFTEINFEHVINEINDFSNNLSIFDFKGKTILLKNVPAGEFKFSHGLGKVPEFRYTIRQVGGGLITDSEVPNTGDVMNLVNGGAIIKELKLLVG